MKTIMQPQLLHIIRALGHYKGNRFMIGALMRDVRKITVTNSKLTIWFDHSAIANMFREEMKQLDVWKQVVGIVTLTVFGTTHDVLLVVKPDVPKVMSKPLSKSEIRRRAALAFGAHIMPWEERKPKAL